MALSLSGTHKVLDVGSGTGYLAIELAKKGKNVHAIDVCEKSLALTKKNAKEKGIILNVYKSDLLSDVKEKFDLVLFNSPLATNQSKYNTCIKNILMKSKPFVNFIHKNFRFAERV